MQTDDYLYRENYDGSFDSICVHCGALVARVPEPGDAMAHEEEHTCIHGIVARTLSRYHYAAA